MLLEDLIDTHGRFFARAVKGSLSPTIPNHVVGIDDSPAGGLRFWVSATAKGVLATDGDPLILPFGQHFLGIGMLEEPGLTASSGTQRAGLLPDDIDLPDACRLRVDHQASPERSFARLQSQALEPDLFATLLDTH